MGVRPPDVSLSRPCLAAGVLPPAPDTARRHVSSAASGLSDVARLCRGANGVSGVGRHVAPPGPGSSMRSRRVADPQPSSTTSLATPTASRSRTIGSPPSRMATCHAPIETASMVTSSASSPCPPSPSSTARGLDSRLRGFLVIARAALSPGPTTPPAWRELASVRSITPSRLARHSGSPCTLGARPSQDPVVAPNASGDHAFQTP